MTKNPFVGISVRENRRKYNHSVLTRLNRRKDEYTHCVYNMYYDKIEEKQKY